MIKAVIFDVDGTLLDTLEYIFQATEHTLKTHGVESPEREYLATLIGAHLEDSYKNLAPSMDFDTLHKTHTDFQLKNLNLVKLYSKVKETLLKLRNSKIKTAIFTSRFKATLMPSLKITGIFPLIDVIVAVDDVSKPKPDPEGVLKALELLEVSKDEAIFVGDTKFDILAGQNAGVKTVAVAYGFGKNLEELKPDYTIKNIEKVLEIVHPTT